MQKYAKIFVLYDFYSYFCRKLVYLFKNKACEGPPFIKYQPQVWGKHRGMEQLVAREDHSLEVSGSSPLPATQDNIEIININLSIKNHG